MPQKVKPPTDTAQEAKESSKQAKQAAATPEYVALLRLPCVLKRVPVSRAAWWRGVKDGRYPAGLKLGPKTTCWLSSDIDKLIADLVAQ